MTFFCSFQGRVCKCKTTKCDTIQHDVILDLYEKFYKLNHSQQTEYLIRECIVLCDVNRRVVSENISRRHCTFKYFLKSGPEKVQICLKTLCNVFSITPRRVQMVQEKMKQVDVSTSDMRGKHTNRPHKISNDIKDLIREHITSLPAQESHYSRQKNADIKYLSANLSIQKLYELFRSKYPNQKATLHLYREIFNSEFKLRFGAPRSDTCAKCDSFYAQLVNAPNEKEFTRIQNESEVHHRKAENSYKSLKEDTDCAKNDSSVVVLCVDLQQVLFCPTLTHSNVFYQRQLSNYNFCIHDVGTNEATMNVWDETVAKRGSAETASCLLSYVLSKYAPLQTGFRRKLIIWSDRCVGQNNNFKILTLLLHLVIWGYFTEVEQKFLCSGHSFLPCDRDFALIEKRKKTARVLHPFQWVETIANARPSKPFLVKVMKQEDFRDISELEKQNQRPAAFKITEAMWLVIRKDDPTSVHVRKSHNILQPWTIYCIRKRRLSRITLPTMLPLLYQDIIPLKKAKKDNLVDMAKYIEDKEIQNYYTNLPVENV